MKENYWDPSQYAQFRQERAQPFFDLLHRIPADNIRLAADLGCGTGELTRELLTVWPLARILGVDSSGSMLSRTEAFPPDARLNFELADITQWRPPRALDCVISNAALHWIEDHAALLEAIRGMLAPGGVLAVQIPNNSAEYAYRVFHTMLGEQPWAARLSGKVRRFTVETPAWYQETLHSLGFDADIWETTYYHQLPDAPAIVEWMKGTALRPIYATLNPAEAQQFADELAGRISQHYTPGDAGVMFPFRRLFFVGQLRGEQD